MSGRRYTQEQILKILKEIEAGASIASASLDGGMNRVNWTYDAAGNRASDSEQSGDWEYDNLNRMTESPAGTYENDVLGSRTWLNRFTESTGKRYTWDAINRLASACGTTNGASYKYRADGMRIRKAE